MEKNRRYYQSVGEYYDSEAGEFDSRYWRNKVLQRLRQHFREEVIKHTFSNILEIGYGTGLDLAHFASVFPECRVYGIDVSEEMCRISRQRCAEAGLNNVRAEVGSVEDIYTLFPDVRFDMIYVFFGALNTVEDLRHAARTLNSCLAPRGVLVLSVVNKWYLAGMLIETMKLRFRSALSRLRPVWGGYSPDRFLPSRCYSLREVRAAFNDFEMLRRQGYCILHPAWYYRRLNRMPGRLSRLLFSADALLNRTFFWRYGEYSLYVLQRRS